MGSGAERSSLGANLLSQQPGALDVCPEQRSARVAILPPGLSGHEVHPAANKHPRALELCDLSPCRHLTLLALHRWVQQLAHHGWRSQPQEVSISSVYIP